MNEQLDCLVSDGVSEERGEELPLLARRAAAEPPPSPERMTAILARAHDAIVAQDPDAELDLDPALTTCVAAVAPDAEPRTVSAFGLRPSAFGLRSSACTCTRRRWSTVKVKVFSRLAGSFPEEGESDDEDGARLYRRPRRFKLPLGRQAPYS